MDNKKKTPLRTLGDGMESSFFPPSSENPRDILNLKLKLRPSEKILKSLRPIVPTGKIIKLVPKYVPGEKKQPKYLTAKPKDPKFVPYEPYKAAVEPIILKKIQRIPPLKMNHQKDKNNIDIQDLVLQMSEMKEKDLSKAKIQAIESEEELIPKTRWEEEKNCYENDIKNLRETNAHLENQLKFQAQVNGELKTLLVAAVGEDLETRVQHLTEAKLILARELVNSAYNLTSHQEQTEWLSGQCEVWRSKFLASSLMVEELARWKSALSNRVNDLQEIIKALLDERTKIRNNQIRSYCNLKQIQEHLQDQTLEKSVKSVINISSVAEKINGQTESLGRLITKDSKKFPVDVDEEILCLLSNSLAEDSALKMLKNPVILPSKPDKACNAVMEAACSVRGGQMFLQHPTSHATCCAHCKGEVQEI